MLTSVQRGFGSSVCPHLGTRSDPETHFAFTTPSNYCHKTDPPEPVSLSHQDACCLTKQYHKCPVYGQAWEGSLPPDIGRELEQTHMGMPDLPWVWISLLGGIGLILVVVFLVFNPFRKAPPDNVGNATAEAIIMTSTTDSQPEVTITPAPTQMPSFTPSPTPILVPTNTATEVPDVLATATPSATSSIPTPGLELMTPFGPNDEYVLHRVSPGESTPILVDRYLTSAEVIWAANVIEGSIRLDQILVILPGRTDPTGIELFYVIFVEDATQVEDLALQAGIPLADLLYFNDLGAGEQIPAGSWLIYPASPD